MTNEIKGKSVLVTGGGRGIGRATSLLCAARGWTVAVNYTHDAAAAEKVVAAIEAQGGRAIAVHADVANDAQVQAMFETIDRALPPLAGLVNNAGVVDFGARVDAMTPARLQRMFAINVFGSFYRAREAIRRMTTKPGATGRPGAHAGGAIVNMSSAAAKLGAPGQFLIQHVTKAPPDPRAKNPKISPSVGDLILRMLQKDHQERPMPGDIAKAITRSLNAPVLKKG